MGVLAPMVGFERDSDVTLAVPVEVAARGRIELTDPEGVPLAVVTVEDTYEAPNGMVGVLGPVAPLPGTISRAFNQLYAAPSKPRTRFSADTTTVVLDSPPTEADLESVSGPVMFLVLVGHGTPRHISPVGLIRSAVAAAARIPNSQVVAVPVAYRADPAREHDFRERVARAYAPGDEVIHFAGEGHLDADIQAIVDADRPTGLDQGVVVLFTGLSGSGKSTIAEALRDTILESGSRSISFLDGDRVRRNLSRGLTFSKEDREANIERIGWVAAEIARHGGFAICSPIAPFDRTRKFVRAAAADVGAAFVLIHVATPLEECERRDRKGLYARARRGEVADFTGISSPYEVPDDADLVIDTTGRTVADELAEVLNHLTTRGLLPR